VLLSGPTIAFSSLVPANKTTKVEAPARGGRIVFLGLAVVLAAGGFWLWSARQGERAVMGSSSRVRSTLHLDTFVLNLADPGQRSYLRVGIDLGLGRELGRGENAPPIAQLRDTILGVLGESRVEDLLTEKGKVKLKEDLLHALQQRMPEQAVEEVYFTEFLIQR
jgi:flagellar basal body-associated protein FliL